MAALFIAPSGSHVPTHGLFLPYFPGDPGKELAGPLQVPFIGMPCVDATKNRIRPEESWQRR